ncbi:MAG: hypothetical protein V4636_07430 [Pseudomonadota bacterium]
MLRNVLIGMLLVATVLLGMAVARLEGYHYASETGVCSQIYPRDAIAKLARHKCLHGGGARNPIEHLIHGVMPD